MNSIFHFILNIIEFSYKKNLISNLKKILPKKIKVFFDIGAHNGETTLWLLKYFNIKNPYLFEPSEKNFKKLKSRLKYVPSAKIFNFALSSKNSKKKIKEVFETSSTTLSKINYKSKYFLRKKKILKFFNPSISIKKNLINTKKASQFINESQIKKIDLVKIDTEGHKYTILKDIQKNLKNIGVILFEHHYDLMILKDYTFRNINNLLIKNNFKQVYKSKMILRKSFEYIYINKKYKFD